MSALLRLRRGILPRVVFLTVLGTHDVLRGLFREHDAAQDRWTSLPAAATLSWMDPYVRSQDDWMGLSYGMSGAFVAWALRRWHEPRKRAARNAAIGGLSLSGFLAVAGGFLTGCCGSPMLFVYINLLGAGFLPLAKPLCAGLTLLSLGVGGWWANRTMSVVPKPCMAPGCSCHE